MEPGSGFTLGTAVTGSFALGSVVLDLDAHMRSALGVVGGTSLFRIIM